MMAEKTLLLVEASGIQNYIFGSNRLAQNVGASELVRRATEDWVENLARDHIIYAAGGNAMLFFDTETQADAFARKLTRRALEEAPGLHLVVARQTYQEGRLRQTHQDLRKKLAQRKLSRRPSTPLLGLGVTAACVYTGAPAVANNDDGQLISAEVQAKLRAKEDGKVRLRQQLPRAFEEGYEFVYDFDDFGTKGESSYLAVIHTDGNRMGERIKGLDGESDAEYIASLRAFSETVEDAADRALSRTVDLLLDAVEEVRDDKGKLHKKIRGRVPCPYKNGTYHLPFRPIVFGGDDVTFVCEGRLGLAVAAHYLRIFSEQVLSDGAYAYARAGIAVVKSHYPFSRAYELAEALAASAKSYIREAKEHCTALDWHYAVSGLVLPLSEVREREYTVADGSLLMRPVGLNPPDGDWRSWETFTDLMVAFNEDPWAGRRNKIKALREALRAGREAVQHFITAYPDLKALPDISSLPTMAAQGWQGQRCGYFDAVEALDFFVPLEEEATR
jgi:hypothetical protein